MTSWIGMYLSLVWQLRKCGWTWAFIVRGYDSIQPIGIPAFVPVHHNDN